MHSDASGDAGRGVVGVSKPATVEQCHAVIDALAGELASLRDKVIILEERLALDSRNSSKPPSSDGPGRGNRAQRRASARKRGAQKGHPGAFRALLPESEVHRVQDCVPPPVCTCGGTVSVRGRPERHQVFDIPPMRPEVSEYRLYSGVCAGCGAVLPAALPPGPSAEHLGPSDYYYWDDFWGLAGLYEAARVAGWMGQPKDEAKLCANADAFRRDIDASLARAAARLGRLAMPA